jgi:acetyl esterase/lipase
MKAHAKKYGGSAQRIFLICHSAGAHIVAGYVLDPSLHPKSGPGVAGAVLISLPASRAASMCARRKMSGVSLSEGTQPHF